MTKYLKLLTVLFFASAVSGFNIEASEAAKLKGNVKIDGSSTVYPITEAIAEEYRSESPRVRVTIGVSGTGGGFKKFLAGETDINDASRSIKSKEIKLAKSKGIDYLELPVAYDGITVIINKANDWASTMTTAELKKIWEPGSTVKKWSEVRKGWPNEEIKLFGPGPDSGTFDYFTKAINGKEHASRKNYTMSEDDNVLVTGVAGNKYALGYLGFAYYAENKGKLKSVAIDAGKGKGAVAPTMATINNGTYAPLSRPIFIYVSKKSGQKPQVKSFVNFYLEKASKVAAEVGYVPMPKEKYQAAKAEFEEFLK